MLKFITLCISLFVSGSTAAVAPFIKPCTQTDSDCIQNSAKIALTHLVPGVPSLGLPALDPVILHDISLNTGALQLSLKNVAIHRLGECTINKIERDPIKSTILLDIVCPITGVGNYKATGNILSVPIEGEGPFEIKTDKIQVTSNLKLTKTNRDGNEYYKISNSDFDYDVLSKFSLKLDNLFNGDKAKAEPIEQILDSSWKELAMDPNIGRPIVKEIIGQLINIIDKFFQAVPSKELEIV